MMYAFKAMSFLVFQWLATYSLILLDMKINNKFYEKSASKPSAL